MEKQKLESAQEQGAKKDFEQVKAEMQAEFLRLRDEEGKMKLVQAVLNGQALEAAGINLEDKSRVMEAFAYGGTKWATQFRSDAYEEIEKTPDIFQTLNDLPWGQENITFGICEINGTKSIILRQRQTLEDRGGYPFTLLISFDEKLWEKFSWNGMSIIKAILDDPIIKFLFLRRAGYIPWVHHGDEAQQKRIANLVFWLESNFKEITPLEDMSAETREIPPEEANPEYWARVLAALPEGARKKARIFIGDAGKSALDWGVKTMFAPKRS